MKKTKVFDTVDAIEYCEQRGYEATMKIFKENNVKQEKEG